MPKINRIRIINFSYNNDRRHIADETFNFHGGDNALLNLANGGGKSVLVQLFMQPIAPEVKIQGRSITSFFRRKKLPAYIMLEWKLDGGGGYLVTGIGIVSAEVSGGEDEKSRIKYFTFISKYIAANAYDIAHIELVKSRGNILEIVPFKEAREMMLERARKDPYSFGYFSDDDGDKYKKRLAEFGIAQDEWKNIIAKINDSEGGLEEIFLKYKNSSQLLNEWIIKSIEKVKFKNRTQARQLEEMLENLVREVAENERFIIEKELLEQFLAAFGGQVDALADLLKGLETKNSYAAKLAALHRFLNRETTALAAKLEQNNLEIEQCIQEKQHIELEERSYKYWVRQAEHQQAAAKLAAAEEKKQETERDLGEAKHAAKVMQAASLNQEIREKEAELSGIEEQLAAARSQVDTDERVRNLEFSLKKFCEKALTRLESELADLRNEKSEQETLFSDINRDLGKLELDLGNIRKEEGRLQERKENHEAYAKEVADKLKISLNRNLLGEIAAEDLEEVRQGLAQEYEALLAQGQKLASDKAAAEARQQVIAQELKEIRAELARKKESLAETSRQLKAYEEQEQEVQGILQKYGFDFSLRFERERLKGEFAQLVQHFKQRLEETARRRDELTESLQALKNGRFHVPDELVSLLTELDVSFETGEAYLRNQPPDIRQQLLLQNPVLPYALIMAGENIQGLAQAMDNLTMRRVVPLIAYEDLNLALPGSGRLARTTEGIALVCLYEGRIFEDDLAGLEAELRQKRAEIIAQYNHYDLAHKEAVVNEGICLRFAYPADYRYTLEKQQASSAKRLQELDSHISRLEQEQDDLRLTRQEIEEKLKGISDKQRKAQVALDLFDDFVMREQDYQVCLRKWSEVTRFIDELETRKVQLRTRLGEIQQGINSLTYDIVQKEQELQGIQEKYIEYQHAQEADIVEGDLAELEQRLTALKQTYKGEITQLEKRQKELVQERNKKDKELKKLGLGADEYAGVAYDEGKLDRIIAEITALEQQSRKLADEEKEAAREESSASTARDLALEEVKKLGAEQPLAPEEIKGDFQQRRHKLTARQKELERYNQQISRQINEYNRLMMKIDQHIDAGATEPEQGFEPEQDTSAQTEKLGQIFKQLEEENRKLSDQIRNTYNSLRADYQDKNPNIYTIFKGLDQLWDQAQLEFDAYYYLYERMSQHKEKLLELIKLYEKQLANLERDKKDLVQQSLLHGMGIYEEILWISDNSKVPLQGRKRPVQMLKVELQLDSQEAAAERMKNYIEECIATVREETRLEKREDEVKKTVAKVMSSRELLNVCLGTAHIPIKVFKIDLNMQNSGLKTWEDAVRENSGGEKFVVFFSLLSALMSYTRTRTLEAMGADTDTDTDSSVLIMDNPFGPISSEHLLNPLFEIARKHRTQLICLSDLKQNSILNCFNLIYMLKIRNAAIGNNEFLKFEEIVRDPDALENDERLEKAYFRVSEPKQITLFD